MRVRSIATLTIIIAAGSACGSAATTSDGDRHETAHAVQLAAEPAAEIADTRAELTASTSTSLTTAPDSAPGTDVAMIGEHGHLGSLTDPGVDDAWQKWQAHPSLDRTVAVMTLREESARTIDETRVSWVSLPDATETDRLAISAPSKLNAVSSDGSLVAFTNFAAPPRPGEIAGAKATTTLWIADRGGVRYEAELDGNFVAEAFGRRTGTDGLPEQIFLLEHLPAEAPRFYRVRVLSTATGEVSQPLNIRDKTQFVDERMSGLSRSQVIADEHGLLFTLYRGTIDGTPTGEPYAFVHTLDLADGVWCLFLDPALELDTRPGSIAVGGDRLYVASANGKVGSIPIPSITDLSRNPEMDWVATAGPSSDTAPVLLADADGVWVGLHDGTERLVRLAPDGTPQAPLAIAGPDPTALTVAGDRIVAAGDGWTSLGEISTPRWFGAPAALFAG